MIRAILVDDEEPARVRLRALLAASDDVEIVGEAQDGTEAVSKIAECRPDLVFLDIEMPGLTGMQVVASLDPPRPRIIFCTAYDQYAVDAFEQNAVDYLLKPLSRRRLAQALERVRQQTAGQSGLQRELRAATEAQARLLPQGVPSIGRLEFAGHCRAASDVGGDFYDFVPAGEGRLGIVVADVSGKGLYAGILMASLQARVQSLAPRMGTRLGPMLEEINRLLHETTTTNRFATLFYAAYDDSTSDLHYVNAGHDSPLLRKHAASPREESSRIERLQVGGPAIGMLPDAAFEQATVRLEPGDLLVLHTDGLTETVGADEVEFGVGRLESVVDRHAALSAVDLRDRILEEVDLFRGTAARRDDLTLVVVKVRD